MSSTGVKPEIRHLYDQARSLLPRVSRAPEQPFPGGASEADLADLTLRSGISLPDSLTVWLRLCKGEAIGPGGVFGARPDCESLDIAAMLAVHPQWRDRGWLPVAGDGCGNSYVLLTAQPLACFVGFVDTMDDPDDLAYVVGSNLWAFLVHLLGREIGEQGWPFDAQTVLARDPGIADAPPELLPWRRH